MIIPVRRLISKKIADYHLVSGGSLKSHVGRQVGRKVGR